MGLQSDTERKGEVKVANSNSHYWKINISISDHGDFLNYLPCPWTRHSTFLVTFSYFYSSTCKLEKHPQKRSPTLLPWTLLTDFNNESCTKKEKANDTELRADFECRYFCPVLSSSVATWPNNNNNAFDCLTYEGGHSNQCKTSFSFSELLVTWETRHGLFDEKLLFWSQNWAGSNFTLTGKKQPLPSRVYWENLTKKFGSMANPIKSLNFQILCKTLEQSLISLYFVRKMWNSCLGLMKNLQIYLEIQSIRQKQSLYNSDELESEYSVWTTSFFSTALGKVSCNFCE